jgi:hypothetical protein
LIPKNPARSSSLVTSFRIWMEILQIHGIWSFVPMERKVFGWQRSSECLSLCSHGKPVEERMYFQDLGTGVAALSEETWASNFSNR